MTIHPHYVKDKRDQADIALVSVDGYTTEYADLKFIFPDQTGPWYPIPEEKGAADLPSK